MTRSIPSRGRSWARRRGLALLVVLATAGSAVACGIPTDSKPRALDPNELPASLSANPGTTMVVEGTQQSARLWFIRSGGDTDVLVGQMAPIPPVTDYDQLPRVVIDQLIQQVPASGGDVTLINAIPPTVKVLDATKNGTVLDLDLSDLGNAELTRQREAFAQIVFTATALPGIDAVRFSIDGQQIGVPLDDQTTAAPGQPITKGDYPKLAPPP